MNVRLGGIRVARARALRYGAEVIIAKWSYIVGAAFVSGITCWPGLPKRKAIALPEPALERTEEEYAVVLVVLFFSHEPPFFRLQFKTCPLMKLA